VARQLVDGLLADLLQDVRFLRVYASFPMQFPTVELEECDFDRQFLFDEYAWPFLIVTI
jgi:hypothetical protein